MQEIAFSLTKNRANVIFISCVQLMTYIFFPATHMSKPLILNGYLVTATKCMYFIFCEIGFVIESPRFIFYVPASLVVCIATFCSITRMNFQKFIFYSIIQIGF